jgi:Tfp pilus assembly protein PilX
VVAAISARREGGIALIVALFMLVLVTLSLLLAARHLQTRVDGFRVDRRSVHLAALADAALAEALAELDHNPGLTAVTEHDFAAGRIGAEISGLTGGILTVEAHGHLHGWRTEIRAQVVVDHYGPKVLSWTRSQGPE